MQYEPPTAIDLCPEIANQVQTNCACANGARDTNVCSMGAYFTLPHCGTGSHAATACLSGQIQAW
jgi:hypothetical protein